MSRNLIAPSQLTPDLLLRAYAAGIFPMSESRDDDEIFWVDPKFRGILPLDTFHVPKSLRKVVRQNKFEIRCNTSFQEVVENCAQVDEDRKETWINYKIQDAYCALHERGFAHSVESWSEGKLVGGLYGVSLGGAFFGESMFSTKTNASKVALVHLVVRLKMAGFRLLDTQFVTEHLYQFGAVEIASQDYQAILEDAIQYHVIFMSDPEPSGYLKYMEQVLTPTPSL